LCVLCGGVYAALGGAPRSLATSTDIELQRGLVSHWKLDGNAKDATPQGNNGTVYNATLTTDRKARANSAYNFNGTNAYIGTGKSLTNGLTSIYTLPGMARPLGGTKTVSW
jgi:hypothetical protein